jgi:hypothetical protein
LPTLLSEKRQAISASELKNFLSLSTHSQEKNAETSTFLRTRLNDIYINEFNWYEKCRSIMGVIQNQYVYKEKDIEDITKDLNEASLNFEKEQVELPDGLIPISKGFLGAIKEMARERLKAENYSLELEKRINETTMAIGLPSE